MKRSLFFLIAGCMSLVACRKGSVPPGPIPKGDYLVVGTSYGFCTGDCTELYRLQDGYLYEDKMQQPQVPYQYLFKDQPMPNKYYTYALPLWLDFPDYLPAHPDTVFGCPDCADQGGILIQRFAAGQTMNWHIDTDEHMQPEAIRPYMRRILALVDSLRQRKE